MEDGFIVSALKGTDQMFIRPAFRSHCSLSAELYQFCAGTGFVGRQLTLATVKVLQQAGLEMTVLDTVTSVAEESFDLDAGDVHCGAEFPVVVVNHFRRWVTPRTEPGRYYLEG